MNELRFIDLETHSAFQNMAIDEAVMQAIRDEIAPPTLRLYRWRPSAVSIGTFQGMKEEVDLDYCKKNGIDYIRRITGGGAVYHDYEGEITYSIILPKDHSLAKQDILESYKLLCGGIVEALNIMNIDAEFKPINDIVASGKKISGNAQTRRHSCVFNMAQHSSTSM